MAGAIVSGIVLGGIYGLIALGIVLVYRGSRVLNLATIEIGTFAVFVAWSLIEGAGMPWVVGAAAGVAAGAGVAFAFERLVVARMAEAGRLAVAVATIGLGAFLFALEVKIWTPAPRFLGPPVAGLGPKIFGTFVSPTQIVSLFVVALIGLGLTSFLRRTDFGLGVLAASQDPVATRMVGVKLWQVSAFTWTAGGALAALAMILVEPTIGVFGPGVLSASMFVPGLAAALVGGLDSPSGAFAGGIAIGLIDQIVGQFVSSTIVPGASTAVLFAAILAVLLLRPQGLLGRAAA